LTKMIKLATCDWSSICMRMPLVLCPSTQVYASGRLAGIAVFVWFLFVWVGFVWLVVLLVVMVAQVGAGARLLCHLCDVEVLHRLQEGLRHVGQRGCACVLSLAQAVASVYSAGWQLCRGQSSWFFKVAGVYLVGLIGR